MINVNLFQSKAEAIDWAYSHKMTVWSTHELTEAKTLTTIYHLKVFIYSNYMDEPVAYFWYENYRIIPRSQSINSNRKRMRKTNA